MKILNIGKTVYAVHRRYIREKLTGGVVVVCRVKTYINDGGTIRVILKTIGGKETITSANHRIFHKLEDAILSITTKKKK